MDAIENYLNRLSPRDRVVVIMLAIFVVLSLMSLGALNLHGRQKKHNSKHRKKKNY